MRFLALIIRVRHSLTNADSEGSCVKAKSAGSESRNETAFSACDVEPMPAHDKN